MAMQFNPTINKHIDWVQSLLLCNLDIPINQEQFNIVCPFHLDSHASCAINTGKGLWICFAGCGEGSLQGFIQRLLEVSDKQLKEYLVPRSLEKEVPIYEDAFIDELPVVDMPMNFIENKFPEWIVERGFSKDFLASWGCGSNIYNDFIIPIRDYDKRIIGHISRRQKTLPKYLYNTGLRKSQLLFGVDKITPTEYVCITEGSLDTMWLQQNGYASVALLGIHLSNQQFNLLKKLPTKEFILCLDNDEAGQIGMNKALHKLKTIATTTYINIPDQYKDVQDIREKFLLDTLIEKRYTWKVI